MPAEALAAASSSHTIRFGVIWSVSAAAALWHHRCMQAVRSRRNALPHFTHDFTLLKLTDRAQPDALTPSARTCTSKH
jgi:hypothetical protein